MRVGRGALVPLWLILACLVPCVSLCRPPTESFAQDATASLPTLEGKGGVTTPGGEVVYTLQFRNRTFVPVTGSVVTQTLPSGFAYVPGSTRVNVGGSTLSSADPVNDGTALSWGPFTIPAAGHSAHNPRGVHTFVQDLCVQEFIDFQLDQALALVGSGGYVTQMFYRITGSTTAPDDCAVYFVNSAYNHNLVPILRLQGNLGTDGIWVKPDSGSGGDYAAVAAGFARYVAGLPLRDTHPLYIAVWNEPDLWIEWSNAPNAGEYGRFFVAVSKAIRRLKDSRIRVLNGAVTPANTAFVQKMLAVPGFVQAFDAWASHCYPYNHPAWYNIHNDTARYGSAAIDCYLLERDTIARYGGRSDFKFVLTETGHGLGDSVYGFEGYPTINESNRADYIADALRNYWPAWPELIAATPYELGGPWGGWDKYDWIDYDLSMSPLHFSFAPHLQYTAVSSLSKPRGTTIPRTVEITFRALTGADVTPGLYTSRLCARAGDTTIPCADTAAARVTAHLQRTYLPTISRTLEESSTDGVWYSGELSGVLTARTPAMGEQLTQTDGAILPTHFLAAAGVSPAEKGLGEMAQGPAAIPGTAQVVMLDSRDGSERAYVGTAEGSLLAIDTRQGTVEHQFSLTSAPRMLAAGPRPATAYISSEADEIVLVDVLSGDFVGRTEQAQRPEGMVFDAETQTLLVADAGAGSVLRFNAELSQLLSIQPLPDLPGQVFLDEVHRRLLVTLPGAGEVMALDADTLQPLNRVQLPGGPLVWAALDGASGRLYVLSVASAEYRVVSVLNSDDLSQLALVGGTASVPLRQATELQVGAAGELLVAEGYHLCRIAPDDFHLVGVVLLESSLRSGGMAADPDSGLTVWIDERGVWFLRTPVQSGH